MNEAIKEQLIALTQRPTDIEEDVVDAYNLGVQYTKESQTLWTEPIRDRKPTREDGDERGQVQFLGGLNFWDACQWDDPIVQDSARWPWLHTPAWKPKQRTLQEQALRVLDGWIGKPPAVTLGEADIDLIRRALEEVSP